jgi:hypothetical protein
VVRVGMQGKGNTRVVSSLERTQPERKGGRGEERKGKGQWLASKESLCARQGRADGEGWDLGSKGGQDTDEWPCCTM